MFLNTAPGGGAFQYSLSILSALLAFPPDRFQLVIVYRDPVWKQYLHSRGAKIHQMKNGLVGSAAWRIWDKLQLPISGWRSISKYVHPVSNYLNSEACDLWIFPSQDTYSWFTPVPALSSILDLMHRYERAFPEVSANGIFEQREKNYLNLCRYSRGILVDSEVGRQQVSESYGFPREKLFVLPYTVPPYVLHVDKEIDVVRRYGLPKKFLFYPAQFWEHKNHVRLLEAVHKLKPKLNEIFLVLVGSPKNAYHSVLHTIERLELEDNTRILGYVPNAEMPHFYQSARAMVMPTFFGPTNIPQLEAFELGCPVATSRIYGIEEQVGDAALLFDPSSVDEIAAAVERLWIDDVLCDVLAQKGRNRAAIWGIRKFANELVRIIDAIS